MMTKAIIRLPGLCYGYMGHVSVDIYHLLIFWMFLWSCLF